jgi:hypothetical protein
MTKNNAKRRRRAPIRDVGHSQIVFLLLSFFKEKKNILTN